MAPKPKPFDAPSMNSDLAYLLGLWVAEGSFEENIGRITITCGDKEVGEFLMSGAAAGLKFKARPGRTDQWAINSYEFMEFMRYLKMPLVKAPQKWIPEWVMQGKREWAMSFVAGLWDGDGYVCDPAKKKSMGFNSSSEQLIKDLQLLMTNIGIVARYTKHVTPPTERARVESVQYRYTLTGENIDIFRRNIRLRILRKQANLEGQQLERKAYRDGIPFMDAPLRDMMKELRLKGVKCKTADFKLYGSELSYKKAERLLGQFEEASGFGAEAIRQHVENGYYWDTVETVEDGRCQTYDFTVPDTHSFWSNGFISHNTPKGYANLYEVYVNGIEGSSKKRAWKSWQFPTIMSPFIPEEEIEAAREDMDPKSFEQEFNASFETMSGRVYHQFDRTIHTGRYPFNPRLPIWVGQDFNVDPMSTVIMQPQMNGEVWVVDEIFQNNSNTMLICDELERRYWRYSKQITIYPDPAGGNRNSTRGESDLDIFVDRGFKRIKYRRKHPPVVDRVNAVNRMFMDAAGNIRMRVDDSCRNLVESLEQTLYKEKSPEINKAHNIEHMSDALGYPIELEFPTRKVLVAGRNLS